MAIDQRKRQKKLARQKAKKKASHAIRGIGGSFSLALQVKQALQAPVYECYNIKGMFEGGMGAVILSRQMPNGDVAMSQFLIDVWCLGVKDAFIRVSSLGEYEKFMERSRGQYELENLHPTCARKIVESAVDYAKKFGFPPHSDHKKAAQLFGDIDASLCPTAFVFGKNGQPFYMSGPKDTVSKSRKIVKRLRRICGDDGFHYVVNVDDPNLEF